MIIHDNSFEFDFLFKQRLSQSVLYDSNLFTILFFKLNCN